MLHQRGFEVREQLPVNLLFEEESIGRYFLGFLINGSIIVELKVGTVFRKRDYQQVKAYSKANNLELGLLILFSPLGVKCKRVLNRVILIDSDINSD